MVGERNQSNVLSLQDGVMCSSLLAFPRLNSKGGFPPRALLTMPLWGECPGSGMRGTERLTNCVPMSDKKLSLHGSLPSFPSVGSYLIYTFSVIWLAKTGVFCEDISEPPIFSVQSSACFDAEACRPPCWTLQMRGYLTSSWNSQWRPKMQPWREL